MTYSNYNSSVLDIDARSRIAIYMANKANSPLIAQMGNLSHDAFFGGFISGDGCMAVSGDASSIQMLPASESFFQTALSQPVCTSMVPVQTSLPVSVPQAMSYPVPASQASNTPMLPQIITMKPHVLPEVLTGMTNQNDFIFLCNMLKLDKVDFDNCNTGIFIRTFVDNMILTPPGWNRLPIYDHDGSFLRMNVLFQESIFELKVFKYVDRLGQYLFRFKPEHSGVWYRDAIFPGKAVILDPDVLAVWNRTSPGNAGLIVAGNIADFDYEVFHGRPVQLVWHSDTPQCWNQFAVALNFLAEAKKHGVEVSLLKCSDSSPANEILDLPQVRKQALSYGLDIPAPLKEIGYVFFPTAHEEFIPRDIPFFWSKGSSALFFGSGYKAILKKLMNAFCRVPQNIQENAVLSDSGKSGTRSGVFPKMQVGVFYSPSTESRTQRLIGQMGLDIPCICSTVLQKEDALETALYRNKIKVLLVVYAECILPKDLADVLDLCERIQIVTGLFAPVESEKKSSPEDVLKGAVKDLVSQSYLVTANGDSVIAKDMETEIYERYTFEPDGRVSVTELKVSQNEEDEVDQEWE